MSGPGQATLTIDADTARFLTKVAQMGLALEGAGKKGAKGFDGIGSAMKYIAGGGALISIASTASNTIRASGEKLKEMSRDAGKLRLELAAAVAVSGGKNLIGVENQVMREPGPTSTDERAGFALSMLRAQGQLRAGVTPAGQHFMMSRRKSEAENLKVLNAYAKLGPLAFGEGGAELQENFVERNMTADQAIRYSIARRPGLRRILSDQAVTQELGMRTREQELKAAAIDFVDQYAPEKRVAEMQKEYGYMNNSYVMKTVSDAAEGVPVLGGLIQEVVTDTLHNEYSRRHGNFDRTGDVNNDGSDQHLKTLVDLARDRARKDDGILRPTPRVNYSAHSEGGP